MLAATEERSYRFFFFFKCTHTYLTRPVLIISVFFFLTQIGTSSSHSLVESRLEVSSLVPVHHMQLFKTLHRWSFFFFFFLNILLAVCSLGCRRVFKRRRRRCLMVFRVGWFPVRRCALAGCRVTDSWRSLMPRPACPARFSGLTRISRCTITSIFNNAMYSLETCKAERRWVFFSEERKHHWWSEWFERSPIQLLNTVGYLRLDCQT